jgi:hypothetical protein
VDGSCEHRVGHITRIGVRERVLKPALGAPAALGQPRQRHHCDAVFGGIPLWVESSGCGETGGAKILTI